MSFELAGDLATECTNGCEQYLTLSTFYTLVLCISRFCYCSAINAFAVIFFRLPDLFIVFQHEQAGESSEPEHA